MNKCANTTVAKRLVLTSALFLSFSLFLSSRAQAGFNLTLAHTGQAATYNLSWETVAPSTTDAIVTYYVFEQFGKSTAFALPTILGVVDTSSAVFNTQSTALNLSLQGGWGSRCFEVMSIDSVSLERQFSDVACHGFVHNLTSEGIARTDGDGTQRGVDQRWTFTYSLDADSLMTAKIYPPGVQFSRNSDGFITSASSAVVKTLVENTPRSSDMASHSITNSETWDSRNSSGSIVSNGIYYLFMAATLDSGFTPFLRNRATWLNTVESLLRDGSFYTVPVDIIRILNLRTTGITLTVPTATISYDITANASVRMVIAKPGSGMTVDSNGDIQPFNTTTGAIDSSLIVSSSAFQRTAGSVVESWSGTSSSGTAVASGVYPVGLSATDDYNNHAVDSSGNDFPIFSVITVERTSGSSGGGSSDTTGPTLRSITPTSGSTVNNPVTALTIVLQDSQSTLNLTGAAVTLRDPNNASISGTLTNNGTDTLTFTPATTLRQSGTYNVSITALDSVGNSSSLTSAFTLNIRLDSDSLSGSMYMFPNPAKNTNVNIRYDVSVDATTSIDVFNILGERVYTHTYSDLQGTATHTWDLKNMSGGRVGSGLYLVRVKANGSGGKAESIKKLVVIQ